MREWDCYRTSSRVDLLPTRLSRRPILYPEILRHNTSPRYGYYGWIITFNCLNCTCELTEILLRSLISLISSCFNKSVLHPASFPSPDAGRHVSMASFCVRRLRVCKITQFVRSRLLKPYPSLTIFLLSISIRVSSLVLRSSATCLFPSFLSASTTKGRFQLSF